MVRRLPDGEPRNILPGASYPRYLASGHLTYIQSGALFAVPFDLDSLKTRGEAVPVLESVAATPNRGGATLSAAMNGTLIYLPGGVADTATGPALWLERVGALRPLRAASSSWATPRFSPDGRRVALTISDGRQQDIWVYDWERDILTRITSDQASHTTPVWTPDGTGLVFGAAARSGVTNLYWQRADGTGQAERLTENASPQLPDSFHPNGRLLAFH